MAQPTWITPAGSIGSFASFPATNVSYQLVAAVNAPGTTLTYKLLSGVLPPGFTIGSKSGIISGTTAFTSVDILYTFTVRTTDNLGYIRDRTFTLKITAAPLPQFVPPTGFLFTTPDSVWISQQVTYTTPTPDINIRVIDGEFPPGLEISPTGLIQGYADYIGYAKRYNFTLEITGETGISTRDYYIDVTHNLLRQPTILNTRPLTITPNDSDIYYGYYLLPPVDPAVQADMGQFIYDDYFAFKLIGYDFDSLNLTYQFVPAVTPLPNGQIPLPNGPAGLTMDPITGWITGYPVQPDASVIGSIIGNILTVTSVTSGKLNIGETILGTGVLTDTRVLQQLTATNPPTATTAGTGASITNTLNVGSSTGITVGQFVSGIGVPPDTYVVSVVGTTVTLSNNLNQTPTGNYNFYVPGQAGTYSVDKSQTVPSTTITAPIDIQNYSFAAQVTNTAGQVSPVFNYKFIMNQGVNAGVTWLTPADLGQMLNSTVSMLSIGASSTYPLQYRVISGSLPPNLTLREDGLIIGRVAYQPTNGITPLGQSTTFTFTVQAYNPGYQNVVSSTRTFTLSVLQEYSQPVETIYMKATPEFDDRDLLESLFDLSGGKLTTIISASSSTNWFTCESTAGLFPGTMVTFDGNVGGVTPGVKYYVKQVIDSKNFSISTVDGGATFNLTSAVGAMNVDSVAIPDNFIYRLGDPYFGKSHEVIYDHAYGIYASDVNTYVNAILLNHYWRRLILGELKTAVARDENGEIIYEVVYSSIIDDLINNDGISISKSMIWPQDIVIPAVTQWFTAMINVYTSYAFEINNLPTYYTSLSMATTDIVYPNSLYNMRTQLTSQIPQVLDSRLLPLWMTSQQRDGSTLGFTPAWVIAYTKPGKSEIIKSNIENLWPYKLHLINFKINKFTVDKSATYNYLNLAKPPGWQNLPSATSIPRTVNGIFPPNLVTSPDNLENWYINMPFQLYGTPFGTLQNNVTYYVKSIDLTTNSFTMSRRLDGPTEEFVIPSTGSMTAQPIYGATTPLDSKDFYVFFPQRTILPGV